MECPNCHSDVWNNEEKVAGGWNGPLRKCKDKECGWVLWPPKDSKKPVKAQRNGAKWTWPQLSVTYRRALLIAAQHVPKILPKATAPEIVSAAATIFISATRDGVSDPVVEQPFDERPKHLDDAADDSILF